MSDTLSLYPGPRNLIVLCPTLHMTENSASQLTTWLADPSFKYCHIHPTGHRCPIRLLLEWPMLYMLVKYFIFFMCLVNDFLEFPIPKAHLTYDFLLCQVSFPHGLSQFSLMVFANKDVLL